MPNAPSSIEAMYEVAQVMKGDDANNAMEKIQNIINRWEDDEEEEEPEEEEESTRPAGSIMWEIEVPVTYYRTYHVPGTSEDDALEFFLNYDTYARYDIFANQDDDQVDGEEDSQARVVGKSGPYQDYYNPETEEWEYAV